MPVVLFRAYKNGWFLFFVLFLGYNRWLVKPCFVFADIFCVNGTGYLLNGLVYILC